MTNSIHLRGQLTALDIYLDASRFGIQSTPAKTDTFGTSTMCPSKREVRLIESQITGVIEVSVKRELTVYPHPYSPPLRGIVVYYFLILNIARHLVTTCQST